MFRLVAFILLSALLQTALCQDVECGDCMTSNGVACISENKYQVCLDGKNPSGREYTCDKDEVCTNDDDICVPKIVLKYNKNIKSPCFSNQDENSNPCEGHCTGDNDFTCVAKNKFRHCADKIPQGKTFDCEPGWLCSEEYFAAFGKDICVPKNVVDLTGLPVTCNKSSPGTEDPKKWCEKAASSQKFFFIANDEDSSCKTYIYCEKDNKGKFVAITFKCRSGYFDPTENKCVPKKPSTCF